MNLATMARRAMEAEAVRWRIAATLAGNIGRSGLSLVAGIVVARGLGAASYGDYVFFLATFAAVSQLLEMGTSSAFYTFLARRRGHGSLLAAYLIWLGGQLAVVLALVVVWLPASVVRSIWFSDDRITLALAAGAAFASNQLWGAVVQLGEAIRRTVLVQTAVVLVAGVHLAGVLAAVVLDLLTIRVLLALMALEFTAVSMVLAPVLVRANLVASAEARPVRFAEVLSYCAPLAVYGWVGFAYSFADRWLLQQFGGSEQQAFFAVGQQFAAVCLIATTSVLKVFWKEVAEARELGDDDRARRLYRSATRTLYAAGAVASCALIPFSGEILDWTLGAEYAAAAVPFAIMLLFPIHQSLGQLTATFQYASGDTRRFALLGTGAMVVSIPVTYVVLAPASGAWPGLGMGATGLALKLVVMQALTVGAQQWLVTSSLNLRSDYGFQAALLAGLLTLGWAAKGVVVTATEAMGVPPLGPLLFALAGLVYAAAAGAILWRRPALAGLSILRPGAGRLPVVRIGMSTP